jgi:hypothetical protein
MEDNLIIDRKIEDDPISLGKWKTSSDFNENGRQTQLFRKIEVDLMFYTDRRQALLKRQMEGEIILLSNWKMT